MNFKNIGALDIRCQCSGFIYAISIADQYVKTGMYQNILVIGAEVQSTGMDLSNDGRNTAIIFADGAGAAIISPTNEDKEFIYSFTYRWKICKRIMARNSIEQNKT